MSADSRVHLELTGIKPARAADGGRRVWRTTLRPLDGPDRRPIVLQLESKDLRSWDALALAVIHHLGQFYAGPRPAHPAALRGKIPEELLPGLLPHPGFGG